VTPRRSARSTRIAGLAIVTLLIAVAGLGWFAADRLTALRATGAPAAGAGAVADPATLDPVPAVASDTGGGTAATRMLVIGDSYTSGEVLEDPADRFSTLIADRLGWNEENVALGGTGYVTEMPVGDGVRPTYQEVLDDLPDADYDVVLVTGGGNDVPAWAEQGDRADAVTAFYRDLRDRWPHAAVYAVSPFWNAAEPPEELVMIGDDVHDAVDRIGGHYLDVGEPMTGHPEWILPDGDHPNPAGNEIIAERVLALMGLADAAPGSRG
jgi:acyl-CoA thioesterase-1